MLFLIAEMMVRTFLKMKSKLKIDTGHYCQVDMIFEMDGTDRVIDLCTYQ